MFLNIGSVDKAVGRILLIIAAVLLVIDRVDGYLPPKTFVPAASQSIYQGKVRMIRGCRSYLCASSTPVPQSTSSSASSTRLNSSRESVAVQPLDKGNFLPPYEPPLVRNAVETHAPPNQLWTALTMRLWEAIAAKSTEPTPAALTSTVPSGQPQQPVMKRIVKAMYEESLPWMTSLFFPAAASVTIHSSMPLFCSVAGELAFLIFCTAKLMLFFDKPTAPQPLLRSREWEDVRNSVWSSHPNTASRRSFLMGWLYDAPYEKLRREDALTFLAWMKHGLPFESSHLMREEIRDLVDHELPELERQVNFGQPLPSRGEYEEPLSCIRFNLEPLRYRHKPLLFYLVTHGAFHCVTHALEKNYGFVYIPAKNPNTDMAYWYRAPRSATATEAKDCAPKSNSPLVFAHGVGGLAFYYSLLTALIDKIEALGDDTPMIFLDLPHVSLRMHDDIPSIERQVDSICRILDESVGPYEKKNVKATFVGHSFGSIILSWMVQSRPERVGSCVFLDPICFQLHQKDVFFNFHLKRVDQRINANQEWQNPLSVGALINLAGTEMHTNNAMLRHFWWATNALWPHDLVKNGVTTLVLLSGEDGIVPSHDVANLFSLHHDKKLTSNKDNGWDDFFSGLFPISSSDHDSFSNASTLIKTHVMDGAAHGEFVLDESRKKKVVRTITSMMRLNRIKNHKMNQNSLQVVTDNCSSFGKC